MSRIGLTEGFTIIPEGTYTFYVYDCTYDEEYGKMVVKMITADGFKYDERFSLMDDNDQPNERALNAFSYFAKTCLNDFTVSEIDNKDLIGHYIRLEIVHNEVISKKNGKKMTFANSGQKAVATEFDSQPIPTVAALLNKPSTPPPVAPEPVDLDALLG